MKCKICESGMQVFDQNTILNRYKITYYKCHSCGAIFTEQPYWLDISYCDAIASTDVGLVKRNLQLFPIIRNMLDVFFFDKKTFLDFAGGYGLWVRMMRDEGYNFFWYDKYCENLFNPSFIEIKEFKGSFDVITALEVFEHLENPLVEVQEILTHTDTLIFTTEIIPSNIVDTNEWSYFARENGQHISFYTHKSLSVLAEKLNRFYIGNQWIHVLSKNRLDVNNFASCLQGKNLNILKKPKTSLLMNDYNEAIKKTYELLQQ